MTLLRLLRPWLFPLAVAALYGIGWSLAPGKTEQALRISLTMFRQLALPLCLAIVIMAAFNLVLSPAQITRFLGKGSGLKGILFSSLAGVLSMGPIYAWHPLFKTLKEQGASTLLIANFMGCRSIKPALVPVLVSYFGWRYTLIFVTLNLVGALVVAGITGAACPNRQEG
ncbi:hypothetical protein [Salidesulfovibrio onnuriiensis]|uniref:hypothetical protein n=1 Tax=Salidesulfovibrio onnuriiensis TaxID=2583823 RepID=UPI0011C9D1C8|nr:hypothetical protein [Salidesulfovibrio onnuriiensis]